MTKRLEGAGPLRNGHTEHRLAPLANLCPLRDIAQPVEVGIGAADSRRHRGAGHIMLRRVFLHAGHRQRTRRLGNCAGVLKNIFHRGTDFIGADGDDVINALANQPKGLLAHLRHGAAIGKQPHLAQRDATSFVQGGLNAGGVFRLHADNPRLWPNMSQIGRHAGQQSAATTTDKHVIQRLLGLPYQLHCHSPLTGNHIGVIKGVNKCEAFRLCERPGTHRGLIEGIAVHHHFGTQRLHRIHFDQGCGNGHDDRCLDAQLRCRQRDTLCVIACRGRHDAPGPGGLVEVNHLVIGATALEGKDRL